MQASHHTITTHTLVILAEVYLVTQDRSNFLIELSLAETLEEVTTSVSEEAWLYNEHAIDICIDYIHVSSFCSYTRISKIIPSFFTIKEGSTFLSKPLFPQGREDVAMSAIAPIEFWYRQRSLYPQGVADKSLRNRVAIVCRLAH